MVLSMVDVVFRARVLPASWLQRAMRGCGLNQRMQATKE